jgi:type IV pilus assembly protein PilN
MIRINLLPVRAARKKESIRLQVSIFSLSLFAALLLMVQWSLSLDKKISELENQVQVAQTYLQKYQKEVKEANKIKGELQKLEQKMDVIVQLNADRTGPVRLMDGLTRLVIPEKMWLTSMVESKGQMTFSGIAVDNKTVADFMTNLEGAPFFGVVDLISSKQVNFNDRKFKEFTITCPLLKAQSKPEEEAS